MIAPCIELEKNIKYFNENKNIYCFIGYCPIFSIGMHNHNNESLKQYSKYQGIVFFSHELLKELFKLSNIVYYKQKYKYEMKNDENNIIELKYDTKLFMDFNNEYSKKYVIESKHIELYDFKTIHQNIYFVFIKSLSLLNKFLEEKDYNTLFNIFENFSNILFPVSNDIIEKTIITTNFFKNLHILYLYFSNYPYLFGVLNDEDINDKTLAKVISDSDIKLIYGMSLNSLIDVAEKLSYEVEKGNSILNEKGKLKLLQQLLININYSHDQLFRKYNIPELNQYYQVKYYLKDIDFCLCKSIIDLLDTICNNYPLKNEMKECYLYHERRFVFYKEYADQAEMQNNNIIEVEQEKIYNNAIKYNNTIVLGDKQFHDLIKNINLPCENIYYLNKEEFSKFFQTPKKIKEKYKICKYFIVMNEKDGKEYLETIRYISDEFGLKLVLIIYIQDKNIKIKKQLVHNHYIHIIFTHCETHILNYYYDSLIRLKDFNFIHFYLEDLFEDTMPDMDFEFPKINTTEYINEQDNGWEMIRNINSNIFKLRNIDRILGYTNLTKFFKDMYKVYKENNCLDLFIYYYANYFGGEYLVEQVTSLLALVKMFIYAYTIEEKNQSEKSFYSLINNDLRSGNPKKICRYLPMINNIYRLLQKNHLKGFNGDVYRAAYFKKELIEEIKPGKKMFNASLWSSSKNLTVAEKFLFHYKKNILLHTHVKGISNIDIHLEKLSQYPNEKEILILPFCCFEVKSFTKVLEKNLEYYILELIYCEEENERNKIENIEFKEIDYNF